MSKHFLIGSPGKKTVALMAITLILGFGLILSVAVQPALANTFQAATSTPTVTATVSSTGTGTPAATAASTAATTATTVSTLAAPTSVGTPTVLVPVTGADLTSPDNPSALLFRVALGLVGLLLIGFGLRSRLAKR